MEIWQQMVKGALLGTGRPVADGGEVPEDLQTAFAEIAKAGQDTEEIFLRKASLIHQYIQAGRKFPELKLYLPNEAAGEDKPYCSQRMSDLFQTILLRSDASPWLMKEWILACGLNNEIVPAELLSMLLQAGIKRPDLKEEITEILGNRGLWLSALNPEWAYIQVPDEELWQTGKPADRKALFSRIRANEPDKALDMLAASWKEETAPQKEEFLKILLNNINEADLPFLESLKNEKAAKVRNAVFELLGHIPGSTVLNDWWLEGQNFLSHKSGKIALVFTKEELIVHLPAPPAPEKLPEGMLPKAPLQRTSPETAYVYAFMANLPPSNWEKHLNSAPEKILELLAKEKGHLIFISALAHAAEKFRDKRWAEAIIASGLGATWANTSPPEYELTRLVPLISQEKKLYYASASNIFRKYFGEAASAQHYIAACGLARNTTFAPLAVNLLATELNKTQKYSKYDHLAPNLHPSAIAHLRLVQFPEPHVQKLWENATEKLLKDLAMRELIMKIE